MIWLNLRINRAKINKRAGNISRPYMRYFNIYIYLNLYTHSAANEFKYVVPIIAYKTSCDLVSPIPIDALYICYHRVIMRVISFFLQLFVHNIYTYSQSCVPCSTVYNSPMNSYGILERKSEVICKNAQTNNIILYII